MHPKCALVTLVAHLRARGFRLFDVQQATAHAVRMGATEIRRSRFIARLREALPLPVTFGQVLDLSLVPGLDVYVDLDPCATVGPVGPIHPSGLRVTPACHPTAANQKKGPRKSAVPGPCRPLHPHAFCYAHTWLVGNPTGQAAQAGGPSHPYRKGNRDATDDGQFAGCRTHNSRAGPRRFGGPDAGGAKCRTGDD